MKTTRTPKEPHRRRSAQDTPASSAGSHLGHPALLPVVPTPLYPVTLPVAPNPLYPVIITSDTDLITQKEVRGMLRISKSTMNRYKHQEDFIPAIRIGKSPRSIRYIREHVLIYMRMRMMEAYQ